jgi:hypothetical protein
VIDRATQLFERFVDQRLAGDNPDPAAFIAEAGDQSDALAGMIAAYVAENPRTGIPEAEVLELASRIEALTPQPWSELLPALRQRRGLTRTVVVRRVAELLGVKGSEPQVAGYVHELETGQLAPTRVRPAVVRAFAQALEAPLGLLAATRSLPSVSASFEAPMFAREASAAPVDALSMLSDEPPPDPRVDDLFTGGPDG